MTQNTKTYIDDFGRKIGGARKDYAAEAKAEAEKLINNATPEILVACKSLKSLIKFPNLEAMAKNGAISQEAARAALITWRSIERKPTSGYYRPTAWANKTAPKLVRIAALLKGAEVSKDETENAEFRTLTAAGWPANPFSFGAYVVKYSTFIGYQSGICSALCAVKGGRYIAKCSTPAEMVEKLRTMLAADSAKRAEGPALAVSRNRAGLFYICPEHNANICLHVMAKGETSADARQYAKEHRAELVERLHTLQQFPALRHDWNRPRVGTDWRKDKNITPEDFTAAFPFYGVEFGNWVTQTERANLLNLAFDGFHDLAQIWGIPADMCALGGNLSFAFASRGIPNAMAHYEPSHRVINLTKKNGAGCMAHEWFHAVDNWVMNQQGESGYATAASASASSEIEKAGFALLQAIRKTEFFQRSINLANYRGDYWVKPYELAARAFEGVCAFLMKKSGVCSDFLVNCVSMDEFTQKDVEHRSEFYPYPTEAEAATLAPYYFAFLRVAFGDCVQMSEAVAQSVAENEQIAAKEAREAAEKRNKDAEREAAQRKEIEAETRTHAEAVALERKAKVTAKAEQVAKELNCDWVHVFENCGYYYAIGCGCGFVFLVYNTCKVAFRFLKENGRIKKDLRGAHCIYLEYKKGVDLHEAIINDVKHGFTDYSALYNVFRSSYVCEWSDFVSKYASDWEEAQKNYKTAQRAKFSATTANTSTDTSKAAAAQDAADEAPADGLELVEIADGVAVVGDSRTTYRNRKAIKAHGATWNKEAQQWQATNAEAVARLRQWFGVAESSATANEQTEEATTTTASDKQATEATTNEQQPTEQPTADTAQADTLHSADEITDTDRASLSALSGLAFALRSVASSILSAFEDWKTDDLHARNLRQTIAQDLEEIKKLNERVRKMSEELEAVNARQNQRAGRTDAAASDEQPTEQPQGAQATQTATSKQANSQAAQDGGKADRLEMLQAAAEDVERLTDANEHGRATLAELYTLCACGVEVRDLIDEVRELNTAETLGKEPAPNIWAKRSEVRRSARNRAKVALSTEEFATLYAGWSASDSSPKAA